MDEGVPIPTLLEGEGMTGRLLPGERVCVG